MVSTAGLRILQRLEHALVAYAHYLGALCVPRRLAVYYPYANGSGGGEFCSPASLLAL